MARLAAVRLKKRAEFLHVQKGVRKPVGALTLEVCPTPPEKAVKDGFRIGFTASRKVGNAVARNRARRRLRAVAAALLPRVAKEGTDYVLIARRATLSRPYQLLLGDLATALRAAHLRLNETRNP
jgi:ribonuclease P protein component